MKKTLILSLALALGITTVCAASPLKNYNAGKVAVDLGLNVPTSNTYEYRCQLQMESIQKQRQ